MDYNYIAELARRFFRSYNLRRKIVAKEKKEDCKRSF
jgi:hypothetical protein